MAFSHYICMHSKISFDSLQCACWRNVSYSYLCFDWLIRVLNVFYSINIDWFSYALPTIFCLFEKYANNVDIRCTTYYGEGGVAHVEKVKLKFFRYICWIGFHLWNLFTRSYHYFLNLVQFMKTSFWNVYYEICLINKFTPPSSILLSSILTPRFFTLLLSIIVSLSQSNTGLKKSDSPCLYSLAELTF